MRTCQRCKVEMIEGFDIKVEGAAYGIKVSDGNSFFARRIGKPKVAICPLCGEISFYIDRLEEIIR